LSLLVPFFFSFLLLPHVLPLFRLLHLAFILLTFRMPISTLRLLRWMSLVLWRHLMPVSALRRFIPALIWPRLLLSVALFLRSRLLLPIRRLCIFRPFVLMFVLRNGDRR
jgi:hypothetical protein